MGRGDPLAAVLLCALAGDGAGVLVDAALGVAEKAQHGRRAVDRAVKRLRHLDPSRIERGARVDQVPKRRELRRGAPRAMTAIGQDLLLRRALKKLQHRVELAIFRPERDRDGEQPLERGEPAESDRLPAGALAEMARLTAEALQEVAAQS